MKTENKATPPDAGWSIQWLLKWYLHPIKESIYSQHFLAGTYTVHDSPML